MTKRRRCSIAIALSQFLVVVTQLINSRLAISMLPSAFLDHSLCRRIQWQLLTCNGGSFSRCHLGEGLAEQAIGALLSKGRMATVKWKTLQPLTPQFIPREDVIWIKTTRIVVSLFFVSQTRAELRLIRELFLPNRHGEQKDFAHDFLASLEKQ